MRSGWLSVPLVLTSHTWENAKNERSHQDPSMAEAMLGEPSDVSRVMFVPDYNTAAVVMHQLYQTHGQIWTLVVPKIEASPDLFTVDEATQLFERGAHRLDWASHESARQRVILTAIGAYQLQEVLKASVRLVERKIPHSAVYMLEPGRFRFPRNEREGMYSVLPSLQADLYPESVSARVFVTHIRPEPLLGTLQPLNTGRGKTAALGFINHGGTLNVQGMLFVNRCTWAHVLMEAAGVMGMPREDLLDSKETAALDGKVSPEGIIIL
jgi:phosphoketolase